MNAQKIEHQVFFLGTKSTLNSKKMKFEVCGIPSFTAVSTPDEFLNKLGAFINKNATNKQVKLAFIITVPQHLAAVIRNSIIKTSPHLIYRKFFLLGSKQKCQDVSEEDRKSYILFESLTEKDIWNEMKKVQISLKSLKNKSPYLVFVQSKQQTLSNNNNSNNHISSKTFIQENNNSIDLSFLNHSKLSASVKKQLGLATQQKIFEQKIHDISAIVKKDSSQHISDNNTSILQQNNSQNNIENTNIKYLLDELDQKQKKQSMQKKQQNTPLHEQSTPFGNEVQSNSKKQKMKGSQTTLYKIEQNQDIIGNNSNAQDYSGSKQIAQIKFAFEQIISCQQKQNQKQKSAAPIYQKQKQKYKQKQTPHQKFEQQYQDTIIEVEKILAIKQKSIHKSTISIQERIQNQDEQQKQSSQQINQNSFYCLNGETPSWIQKPQQKINESKQQSNRNKDNISKIAKQGDNKKQESKKSNKQNNGYQYKISLSPSQRSQQSQQQSKMYVANNGASRSDIMNVSNLVKSNTSGSQVYQGSMKNDSIIQNKGQKNVQPAKGDILVDDDIKQQQQIGQEVQQQNKKKSPVNTSQQHKNQRQYSEKSKSYRSQDQDQNQYQYYGQDQGQSQSQGQGQEQGRHQRSQRLSSSKKSQQQQKVQQVQKTQQGIQQQDEVNQGIHINKSAKQILPDNNVVQKSQTILQLNSNMSNQLSKQVQISSRRFIVNKRSKQQLQKIGKNYKKMNQKNKMYKTKECFISEDKAYVARQELKRLKNKLNELKINGINDRKQNKMEEIKFQKIQIQWADPNQNQSTLGNLKTSLNNKININYSSQPDLKIDSKIVSNRNTQYVVICSNKTFRQYMQSKCYPFSNCSKYFIFCGDKQYAEKSLDKYSPSDIVHITICPVQLVQMVHAYVSKRYFQITATQL